MDSNKSHRDDKSCRIRHSELFDLIERFRLSVIRVEKEPESEEAQCDLCLDSRSAYTEFYSVCESDSVVYHEPAKELKDLLERSLNALPEGDYFDSVNNRLKDFDEYLTNSRNTSDTDNGAPVIAR